MKYKILLASLLSGFISCTDFIEDVDPVGQTIPSNLDDVELILNNTLVLSGGVASGAIRGGTHDLPYLLDDNVNTSTETLALLNPVDFKTRAFLLEPVFGTVISDIDVNWDAHYQTIGYANQALKTLDEIEASGTLTDSDAITRANALRGEALLHRAYHYFMLVNIYGPHYGLPEAANAESGVPIITVFPTLEVPTPRATVNEVYDFIINDATTALPLMTETPSTLDRLSLRSAYGFLARLYLHMGRYDEALENAELALDINNALLDYNELIVNNFFGTFVQIPRSLDNPEWLLFKQDFVANAVLEGGGIFATPFPYWGDDLIALYNESDDVRFMAAPEREGNKAFGNIFTFALRSSTGVTVPEALLIQAECLARANDTDGAINALNTLRASRYTADAVAANTHLLTAANAQEALDLVVDERRREFHTTGKRFFTIKRLNAMDNAGISITRGGTTWSANSINWACPIAERVVLLSEGSVTQTPRE